MNPTVLLMTPDGTASRWAVVGSETHADFLESGWIEAKVVPVDATVVDGPLPEVEVSDTGSRAARGDTDRGYSAFRTSGTSGTTGIAPNLMPEWHEFRARQHLALAAHLREHPPVDEEQVKALNALMVEAANLDLVSIEGGIEFERFLVERGVRVGGESR